MDYESGFKKIALLLKKDFKEAGVRREYENALEEVVQLRLSLLDDQSLPAEVRTNYFFILDQLDKVYADRTTQRRSHEVEQLEPGLLKLAGIKTS